MNAGTLPRTFTCPCGRTYGLERERDRPLFYRTVAGGLKARVAKCECRRDLRATRAQLRQGAQLELA